MKTHEEQGRDRLTLQAKQKSRSAINLIFSRRRFESRGLADIRPLASDAP